MNATTFTIESVHGVKQTFVLGPLVKAAESNASKPQPTGLQREADAKATSNGSRSPH